MKAVIPLMCAAGLFASTDAAAQRASAVHKGREAAVAWLDLVDSGQYGASWIRPRGRCRQQRPGLSGKRRSVRNVRRSARSSPDASSGRTTPKASPRPPTGKSSSSNSKPASNTAPASPSKSPRCWRRTASGEWRRTNSASRAGRYGPRGTI